MISQTKYYPALLVNRSTVQNVMIVLISSIALGLVSQVALHLWWPVPVTLQSAMVVLLGLTIGSKRAAAAVVLYLLQGAIGLPVFAGGLSGFIYLVGPSGGFLWGFLPAAFLAGYLMEKGMAKNVFSIFATALVSSAVIFFCGALYLHTFFNWQQVYAFGIQPFLLIEPVKLLIAASLAQFCWKKQ